MELYACRNRKGDLHLFTTPDLVKNRGGGYWLPTFNSKSFDIPVNREEFPEVDWSDAEPTRLELVNPNETKQENFVLPGTIEVNISSSKTEYNNFFKKGITVFTNDISWIESAQDNTAKIHMKNGETICCTETQNEVLSLLSKALPNSV